MCMTRARTPQGDYRLDVSPGDMERYLVALGDVLLGDGEADHRTIREMRIKLKCATRIQPSAEP